MIPGGRYPGEGILGLYSGKNIAGGGIPIDGSWTRGSSYSDIRSVGFHRNDPVYEEIEKPNHNMSPRASVSDLSEDEGHMYPHDVDIYHRNIYGQQVKAHLGNCKFYTNLYNQQNFLQIFFSFKFADSQLTLSSSPARQKKNRYFTRRRGSRESSLVVPQPRRPHLPPSSPSPCTFHALHVTSQKSPTRSPPPRLPQGAPS